MIPNGHGKAACMAGISGRTASLANTSCTWWDWRTLLRCSSSSVRTWLDAQSSAVCRMRQMMRTILTACSLLPKNNVSPSSHISFQEKYLIQSHGLPQLDNSLECLVEQGKWDVDGYHWMKSQPTTENSIHFIQFHLFGESYHIAVWASVRSPWTACCFRMTSAFSGNSPSHIRTGAPVWLIS